MGVISTRHSRLSGDGTIAAAFRSANASFEPNLKELVHSSTRGGRQRLTGVKDWNGTWEEYGYYPAWYPGDEVTYIGSIDGTADDRDLQGDAIVTQTVITIPVGTQDPPTVSGTFRGVAAVTKNDNTGVALPSNPDSIEPAQSLCVQLSSNLASPSYSAEDGTTEIVITLSIEVQEFNHCGTSGYMDAIESLWDANVTYKRYVDDLSDIPVEGTPYLVRVPIPGGMNYSFAYMRVGTISDIMFDREGGGLLLPTIPLEMSIIEDLSGTATVGAGVTKPVGGTWRPTES